MINNVLSVATIGQPAPEVGMGATELLYTDRHACTVIKVFEYRKQTYVTVQRDKAKLTTGSTIYENQEYTFEANPSGRVDTYRFDGTRWVHVILNDLTNRWKNTGGSNLRIGERDEYYDPCL
jgi:hypothetical protein